MMAVRVRVVFEDRRMLSKSNKKEGLKRCWLLLKSQLNTIADLTSHLLNAFSLRRTCPDGISLSMDGFVLPPFESTSILKDKDIVCVKRKGSRLAGNKSVMLQSASHGHGSIELPKLLASEGFQEEEAEGFDTVSEEDNNDQLEDAVYEEPTSKKRKASKKHKSPSKKKRKLSSPEKLAVFPEVHNEENGSSQGLTCHKLSASKKDKDKSLNLSSQPNKSSNLDLYKLSNDKSEPQQDEKRLLQPQGDVGTKKTPSRSARRKKAKRKWLREQLKLEKEKLNQSSVLEKGGLKSPVKNNNFIACDVQQRSDEEDSEAEDDMVPVEIRPGHIRFQSLKKDQAAPENQFPVETCQWNGITSKKKGQKWGSEKWGSEKWGKERTSSHKLSVHAHSSQECPAAQNGENKHAFAAIDFDKLTPYTGSPKEGDVIAYRLVELSASWTPELSSFRVGKVTRYDAESRRISLEPIFEYPFEFKKKVDEDDSSVQFDPSPYGEDGSLEIEYSSVADVRMVNHGNTNLTNVVSNNNTLFDPSKATNSGITAQLMGNQTAVGSCESENGSGSCESENGSHVAAKENGKVNVWDEINEALMAKKAKLSQQAGWRKEESSGTQSWSNRALRCSALGPTMALLRSQNGL